MNYESLILKVKPVKEEVLSPKKFIQIPRGDIQTSKVIPPKIGSRSLGKIKVVYKNTKLRQSTQRIK